MRNREEKKSVKDFFGKIAKIFRKPPDPLEKHKLDLSTRAKDVPEPILNHRPATFAALSMAAGLLFGAVLRNNIIATLFLLLFALILGIVFCCLKKRKGYPVLFCCLGMALFFLSYQSHLIPVKTYPVCVVQGQVAEIENAIGEEKVYLLDNVTLNAERVYERLLLTTVAELQVGDIVEAEGSVDAFPYEPFDSYSMSFYHRGIQYKMEGDAVKTGEGKISPLQKISEKLNAAYQKRMGEEGGLASALFLGDRAYLSAKTEATFRAGGIAHVFAVSGLHVGFLSAAVLWIFKKLRLNLKLGYGVSLAILIFYGALTGFPSSILRALIVFAVFAVSRFFLLRPDPLSSLGIAFLITELFFPLAVFELGFQMSYLAVLGILCFYPTLSQWTKGRNRFVRTVGNSVAVSLAANAFLLPLCFSVFSSYGVYFVVANLLVLPIISVGYTLLAFVSVLVLIFEGFSVLLVPIKYIFVAVNTVSTGISKLPYATITVSNAPVAAVAYALTLLWNAPFLKLKPEARRNGSMAGLLVGTLLVAVS